MASFLDVFGARRRRAPRVAVEWPVEIQALQGGTAARWRTCDVSRWGLRLQGGSAEEVRALLSDEGQAVLRLHLPDGQEWLEIEVELLWGIGSGNRFLTGWQFVRIAHPAQQALDEYIAAHPEQFLREPDWR